MAGTYAVIGDPIDHSLSPNIHSAAFRELGMDCSYIAYRIRRDELEEGVGALKRTGIRGFNVTIPHKVGMMRHLDRVDEACSAIGAVNTVDISDGILIGYNTDMDGFLEPIRRRNLRVDGADVLLLGAGGAARAIVAAFAREKAGSITVANRTRQNASELVRFADRLGVRADAIGLDEAAEVARNSRFVINSTPVGTGGGRGLIPAGAISEDSVVYDIVYSPVNTGLIRSAKESGATIIYGYEMLLGQACRAFEIWHRREAPYEAMRRAILGGFG